MKNKSEKLFEGMSHIILLAMGVCIIIPFLLVFMSSITDENTLILNGYSLFPKKISFEAYNYIINQGNKILKAYSITIIVTIVGTTVNLFLSLLMAYPLTRKKLPYRNSIAFFVFFTILFNGGLVPTYLMYTNVFHIKNTIYALIIPTFMLNAYNVLLIRTYLTTNIPEALYEAAEIDGASHFSILFRIVMPLAVPVLITMGLFTGLGYWNDWTNGLYYLTGNKGQSLYGIQNLLNQMITDIQYLSSGKVHNVSAALSKIPSVSVRMAIAFVAMVPLFIIYPFLQKYFEKGITVGAVKG